MTDNKELNQEKEIEKNSKNSFLKKLKNLKLIILFLIWFISILFSFGLGFKLGTKKALLSSSWFKDYQRMFLGPAKKPPFKPFHFFEDELINHFGLFGEVIKNDILNSQIIIKDNNNLEKVIKITQETIILKFREKIDQAQIKEGEQIMVISSSENNEIKAKFIRVFPKIKL